MSRVAADAASDALAPPFSNHTESAPRVSSGSRFIPLGVRGIISRCHPRSLARVSRMKKVAPMATRAQIKRIRKALSYPMSVNFPSIRP